MNPSRKTRRLPHEWLFGTFFVIQWLRLVFACGPLDRDARHSLVPYVRLWVANRRIEHSPVTLEQSTRGTEL